MAHFAVTDVAERRFRAAQKLSRAALDLAGAESEPARVWIDDWSLAAAPGGAGSGRCTPRRPGYAIELTLTAAGAPVLNGVEGLSRKAADPGAASYYYSVPRLRVRGSLTRGGETLAVRARLARPRVGQRRPRPRPGGLGLVRAAAR